jgi:serine/threonine protein phosphatase 1
MATIAVGDIHGSLEALDDLLRQLREAVGAGDTVVFLGDYIDRGPRSRECVDALLEFRGNVGAAVSFLCGNHEDWLLRTRRDYRRHSWLLGMEAFDTIRSYSVEAAVALREAVAAAGPALFLERAALPYDLFFDVVPESHMEFFESLLTHHEGPDCICAHGGLDPSGVPLENQSRNALLWGGDGFPEDYRGAEIVVYGHWNNAEVDLQRWPHPRILGRTIGLDTISHGVLTAMRLPDRHVFQSARYDPF